MERAQGSGPPAETGPGEVSDDISDIHWVDAPALLVFWILLVIVFLQFYTRYVLNDSLGWTEEIARYLLIFVAFIGSVTCVRRGSHIFLEFFYRYLPRAAVRALAVIVEAINAVFFAAAAYLGVGLARDTAYQNMVSVQLPKGIIYWTVVACCVAMAGLSVWRAVRAARTGPEHLHEAVISE